MSEESFENCCRITTGIPPRGMAAQRLSILVLCDERRRMLHRRNLRYGQGWRVGNRSYEARKRHENHGDCRSPWIAALGQHARGEPSRLVQLCFDFYMIEAKPENLIGDRAYDSD